MSDVEPTRDWAVEAADRVVDVVDLVREKTTGPALKAGRWVVYGVAMLFIIVPTVIGLVIGLIRLLDKFWGFVFDKLGIASTAPIWVSYLTLGVLFVAIGLFVWTKRFPSEASTRERSAVEALDL